jgi:signal transduction histidine kinase
VLLALIDATMLVIILSPVLYFCLLRPLIKIIQQRKQAEAELRNYRDSLEELVNERTTEISALLECSRIVLKHREFNWVDLGPLTHKVLSICKNKIKKTVKLFIREVPEELPKIYTDPYSLEQVLINMLLNAARPLINPIPG